MIRLLSLAAFLFFVQDISACPDVDGLLDTNCDGRIEILTFGNSITYGRGDAGNRGGYPKRLKQLFPNVVVRNLGNPGEDTSRGRTRAAQAFRQYRDADYIFILEGVNDYFTKDRSALRTRSNLLSMVHRAEDTGAIVLLCQLTATKRAYQEPWVRTVNRAIGGRAAVNFHSLGTRIISGDLLHPNAAGYTRMANLARTELLEVSERHRPRDTDGDTVYDYEEPRYGADRQNADTDGDGVPDGEEIYTYHSRPDFTDTDGDGFLDFEEIRVLRSDPTDPRPSPPRLESIAVVP